MSALRNCRLFRMKLSHHMVLTMTRRWIYLSFLVSLWLVSSWGCLGPSFTSSGPRDLSSGPYLIAEPAELHWLHELSEKQERLIRTCPASPECEGALYTHAVIALFENGANAASELKGVVTHAPSSPFAAAGARWLQVLEMGFPSSSREHAMRAYLSQQVLGELMSAPTVTVQTRSPHAGPSSSFGAPSPALQQRVKDQERHIAELTTQLQMLKRIDQGRMKDR